MNRSEHIDNALDKAAECLSAARQENGNDAIDSLVRQASTWIHLAQIASSVRAAG